MDEITLNMTEYNQMITKLFDYWEEVQILKLELEAVKQQMERDAK